VVFFIDHKDGLFDWSNQTKNWETKFFSIAQFLNNKNEINK
jgi:hypothetical protein